MSRLLILSLLIAFACQQSKVSQAEVDFIDFPAFTNSILENMHLRSADVSKTFVLNSNSETKTIKATDSVFWSKELELLRKVDLEAPRYRGALELSERNNDSSSNLFYDRITTTDTNLELQSIELYYLEERSQVRKLELSFESDNFIANSNNHLTIWLNEYDDQLIIDSLITIGQAKVLFQEERMYESHVRRIRR